MDTLLENKLVETVWWFEQCSSDSYHSCRRYFVMYYLPQHHWKPIVQISLLSGQWYPSVKQYTMLYELYWNIFKNIKISFLFLLEPPSFPNLSSIEHLLDVLDQDVCSAKATPYNLVIKKSGVYILALDPRGNL